MSVYKHFGYSLNRSSYTQVYNGASVSTGNLQAGDLVFYKYGGNSISHVAIYIGGGQIIHAPYPGEVVKVASVNIMSITDVRRYW